MIVVNQAYHYAIFMNETNSPGILDCDERYWENHVEALNVVKGCHLSYWHVPWSIDGGLGFGRGRHANQSLKYRIEGMNGTMYMFSMNDVNEIEDSGLFHYNSTLSMIRANGTVDVP